jgi:hypothetical protein
MSIDPNELRRLHEAATPVEWLDDGEGCITADRIPIVEYPLETRDGALIVYLRNHVPDILAALEDRERLNKLEALLREGFDLVSDNNSPGNPYFFLQLEGAFGHDEVYRGDNDLRAAIAAARAAK